MVTSSNMKVLVLAPFYNFFMKGYIDALSKYVKEVNVFVNHNYLAEISRYITIGRYFEYLKKFTKSNLVVENGIDNLNIYIISSFYVVPDGNNWRLGDKLAKKFELFIKKNDIEFDLIAAHHTYPRGFAGVQLKEKFDVPLILTIHENRDLLLKEFESNNKKIHSTWKEADALIRVNKKDVSLLKEFNDSVYHIPNGFNPNKMVTMEKKAAREMLNIPPDHKVVFTLGDLSERKGFGHLISAMEKVTRERNKVLCFIGGHGPLKTDLKKQIKNAGLSSCVNLLGFIPDEKIAYWMNAADIFVLPSLSEGNPTVMFECLGIGLPFVGTTVGGVPEVINSENYGLLVKPADSKDLSDKILTALDKEWNRTEIKGYATQFSWENIVKRTVNIYENFVKHV